jgi:hypothetical protein
MGIAPSLCAHERVWIFVRDWGWEGWGDYFGATSNLLAAKLCAFGGWVGLFWADGDLEVEGEVVGGVVERAAGGRMKFMGSLVLRPSRSRFYSGVHHHILGPVPADGIERGSSSSWCVWPIVDSSANHHRRTR